jgi:hypothetical protein
MAITASLSILNSDFGASLLGISSACSPNVLRVEVALTGGSDTGLYCKVRIGIPSATELYHTFRMVNKSFNGTSGEFYLDVSDILPYFFTDISDDDLTTGSQEVVDTFVDYNNAVTQGIQILVYSSADLLIDNTFKYPLKLLFSSKQIGDKNGSNEVDIASGLMPTFLAQKNKTSYIYFYGSGTIDFEKVDALPEEYVMVDNFEALMVDNDGNAMINEY